MEEDREIMEEEERVYDNIENTEFFKDVDFSSDYSMWIINKKFFVNNSIFYKTRRNLKSGYLILFW
ncbi:MAG: hypothetical protein ACW972_11545, partial [Promethearchaeota archaeon]